MNDDLPPGTEAELASCEAMIESWLASLEVDSPVVAAVHRDGSDRRWLVRMRGDDKDNIAVWFALGQRTLHYECQLMPAPEEHQAEVYELLLRRNEHLYGLAFCIGAEDAIYARGQCDVHGLDRAQLDRLLGTIFVTVERFFRPAMRLGYASRFRG